MRLDETGEDSVVARITGQLTQSPHVQLGPGDDCAAVQVDTSGRLQLLKTDCVVETIHFLREHDPSRVGWKALCRAISDIAACGGSPSDALITLAVPGSLDVEWVDHFYRGLVEAARCYGVSIVGGETSRSPGPIFISVSMTGWVGEAELVRRSGGRIGDLLYVTGELGGSGTGHHLDFRPRVEQARWLVSHYPVRSMMDLSDGLGSDLPRLSRASGVGFRVSVAALPKRAGCSIEQAIGDGEDYELLFSIGSDHQIDLEKRWQTQFPSIRLTRIGELVDPEEETSLPAGFSHF